MLQGSMMVMLTDWPADLILLADADARFIWGFNTTISLSRSSQGIRIDQEEEWKKRVFRHMHVTEARMPDWDLEMPTELRHIFSLYISFKRKLILAENDHSMCGTLTQSHVSGRQQHYSRIWQQENELESMQLEYIRKSTQKNEDTTSPCRMEKSV
jgi:hypothetical protein